MIVKQEVWHNRIEHDKRERLALLHFCVILSKIGGK